MGGNGAQMDIRFSDRMGITRPPELARQEVSDDLRVALWNVFQPQLFHIGEHSSANEWRTKLIPVFEFLHWRVHEMSYHDVAERNRLENWYFNRGREWYEIYNLVEFVAGLLVKRYSPGRLFTQLNQVLRAEGSPYHFLDGVLTQITDPAEIQAVRDALSVPDRFAGARAHLTRALELLGQRPDPDYRNAIKEAISSVESTLKILTEHTHAGLHEALQEFARIHPIHGALLRGLDSLYGYTSSEHGLRHALLEADANVGFAEAKFMIVACAAFVSFLITLASQPSAGQRGG
jgi:hypothetical protein